MKGGNMEALAFLKRWSALCNEHECNLECPMYYDYCPLDPVCNDREETMQSIVDYVINTKLKGEQA
jgi:hypothetical protein